ncbi:MAG TPA: hypothetical protein VE727_00995, partial [Solirubrobacterales bacterium]|nr:hypothetical protein [Solirubrobacterales bacterium]
MSVVVPFRGGVEDAEAMLGGLRTLELGEGDEVIIADNGGEGVTQGAVPGCFRLLRADGERSAYHARNAGAAVAR